MELHSTAALNSFGANMPIYYKLTDQDGYTRRGEYNQTLWGRNVTHSVPKSLRKGNNQLCSSGFIHFYHSPELAVLLNPIHANIESPVLWSVKAKLLVNDKYIKAGARTVTTIEIVPLPNCTTENRIRFAISCALAAHREETFIRWANNWLSADASAAAYATAYATAYANAHANAYAAGYANAYAAAYADAGADDDAYANACACACAAVRAVTAATYTINLLKLAKEALL